MAVGFIAGVGMTPFAKKPATTVKDLAATAVQLALKDANLDAGDVDIVFAANAAGGVLHGQEMVSGQVALRNTGLLGKPIINVENACASSSSAFHLASMAVRAGVAEVALAVGFEKLSHEDKQRSLTAIATAADLDENPAVRSQVEHVLLGRGEDSSDDGGEESSGKTAAAHSVFMDTYAEESRAYMASSGATAADFALVAVKNHRHADANPNAQYGGIYSVNDILASREIVAPLTLLMCAPVSDGAAAVIVCSSEFAQRHAVAGVPILGSSVASGRDRAPDEQSVVSRASGLAYEEAGVGPEDVEVWEVHDAAAPAELMLYEELGMCMPGDGAKLIRSGETELGGERPVNVSGGLISRGHPIGATGAAQIYEITQQLRGRSGARQVARPAVGLAQNSGGHLGHEPAVTVTTILGAPKS